MSTTLRMERRGIENAPAIVQVSLLTCGIAAVLLYVAMNVIGPLQYPGYSVRSQTISELSAIGAPSRPLWVALALVYNLLVIAFGAGVWGAAGRSRALRVAGILLIATGAIGFLWPPMHVRGETFSLTDAMHIAVTALSVLLFLLIIGFGAAAFGRWFRLYSITTLAVHLVFGVLTSMYAGPRIAANLATPGAGILQRINTGAYMLWIVVFAVVLLRARKREAPATHGVTGALGHWLLG